jgi:hypothetical protein
MTTQRLAPGVWLAALSRQAAVQGDYVCVLHKGDAQAGSIVLCERQRNGQQRFLTPTATLADTRAWLILSGTAPLDEQASSALIARLIQRDFDQWIIEIETDDIRRYLDGPLLDPVSF